MGPIEIVFISPPPHPVWRLRCRLHPPSCKWNSGLAPEGGGSEGRRSRPAPQGDPFAFVSIILNDITTCNFTSRRVRNQ